MSRERLSLSIAGGLTPFAALEQSPLFEGLDRADVHDIVMTMRPLAFDTGAEVVRAGDVAQGLLFVVNGLVEVLSEREAIASKRRRGDIVGAISLISGKPHAGSAVAAMPTEILELERSAFDAVAARYPRVMLNMARILGGWIEGARATGIHERGEAVALIVGPELAAAVPALVDATAAASPGSVAMVDTRDGFDAAVAGLDDLLDRHRTVLVVARAEGQSAPLLLAHIDRALVLVGDEREAERFAGRERHERIEVALAGPGLRRPAPHERRSVAGRLPIVRIVPLEDGALGGADLAWLGRHLARTKLGLALGAGGAKGYAHVGVLQVLEEAGFVVDAVAGSSIGAIGAAYLGLGMDAAAIEHTLRTTLTPENVAELFKLSLAGTSSGIELQKQIFRTATREQSFDDTVIPVAIMTVDLVTRAPAPIRDGPLWEALLAATALAGMFPPHVRNGQRLVDGLALVPVPTGCVIEDGADVTLSVNLVPRETLPAWPGEEPEPEPPARRSGSRMLETLLEVMDLMQMESSNRHADAADVSITPRFGPGEWRDFHLADRFLAAGREAAQRHLPELLKLARPAS